MNSHVATGIIAILIWFALFAAGVTIDSSPYREALAAAGTPPAGTEGALAQGGDPGGTPERTIKLSKLRAFLGVIAFYTPLNVALLTILAGLVGGCASRLTYARAHGEIPQAGDAQQDLRTMFRIENPVASMLRSFLVYLAFLSGIFITTNDPFGSPTADQYVRLAGLLSFVSFVVGYDPTRFQEILSLRPAGKGKG